MEKKPCPIRSVLVVLPGDVSVLDCGHVSPDQGSRAHRVVPCLACREAADATLASFKNWKKEPLEQALMLTEIIRRPWVDNCRGWMRVDVSHDQFVDLYADPCFQRLNQSLPEEFEALPKKDRDAFVGSFQKIALFVPSRC